MYLGDEGPFWFAIFLLIGAAGGLLFYLIAFLLAPRVRSPIKEETFESGQIPPGGKRVRLVMQYFAFLLLFLIFDVVSMFLYAWGASYYSFTPTQSIYALLLLLFILPPIYLTLKVARSVGV